MRGGSNRIDWTDAMLATFRAMRRRGEPILICAEAIGIDYKTAYHKARSLGINNRMNHGSVPGTQRRQGRAA